MQVSDDKKLSLLRGTGYIAGALEILSLINLCEKQKSYCLSTASFGFLLLLSADLSL